MFITNPELLQPKVLTMSKIRNLLSGGQFVYNPLGRDPYPTGGILTHRATKKAMGVFLVDRKGRTGEITPLPDRRLLLNCNKTFNSELVVEAVGASKVVVSNSLRARKGYGRYKAINMGTRPLEPLVPEVYHGSSEFPVTLNLVGFQDTLWRGMKLPPVLNLGNNFTAALRNHPITQLAPLTRYLGGGHGTLEVNYISDTSWIGMYGGVSIPFELPLSGAALEDLARKIYEIDSEVPGITIRSMSIEQVVNGSAANDPPRFSA